MRTCAGAVCFVVGLCSGAQAGQLLLASVPWAGGIEASLKLEPVYTPKLAELSVPSAEQLEPAAEPEKPAAAPVQLPAAAAPAQPPPVSAKPATSRGTASFYDTGRMTASGEPFAPLGFTAAHRFLPFGTKLRVTNKVTGQSIVVRVNDRGPFVAGRTLDLSLGAARAIGMERAGIVPVTMEVVSDLR